MRIRIGAVALGWALMAVPVGVVQASEDVDPVEVETLGAAHAAEHAELRRIAAERAREWAAMTPAERRRVRARKRAQQRALTAQAGAPEDVGSWDVAPFPIPNFAIHAALLPTGKVLTWGYPPKVVVDARPNFGEASVWDPATGTGGDAFKDVPPPVIDDGGQPASIYCTGETLLPDGSVVMAGGNKRFPGAGQNYAGLDTIFTFNPWNETWTQQPSMRHGRWYPSQVQLSDGRTVIVGGYDETEPGGHDTRDVEVFTPAAELDGQGSVELMESASRQTALYPHLFLMPDGNVLLGGPGKGDSAILKTNSFTWQDLSPTKTDRIGGNAVLQLAGPDGPTRVTQIGGYDYVSATADSPAQATTQTLTYSDSGKGWQADSSLHIARSYSNTVMLPDGSMVVVGGAKGKYPQQDDNFTTYEDGRARQVELWDRNSNSWTLGPPQQEDRGYHSTALLLPDGRVYSAGDDLHPDENSDTAEIYSPPYMFKGDRPVVTSVPGAMPWGKQFAIHTSGDILQAVLMAPSATTHGADMNQRRIPLRITKRVPGEGLNAVTPEGPATATPGWYMLFVVDAKGVPSIASWLQLRSDAPDPPIFDTDPPHPRLSLERTSVKRMRKVGRVRIKLTAEESLKGRMDVKLKVRPRDGRSFYTPLGFSTGQLLAEGETSRKLTFALSRSQKKQMLRAESVDVVVKLKVTDAGNNVAKASLRKKVS